MRTLVLILLLFTTSLHAQQSLKNGCPNEIEPDSINSFLTNLIKYAGDYRFTRDTMLYDSSTKVFVYKDEKNHELQIWIDIVTRNGKYKLNKICGEHSTIMKLYADYFGRNIDTKKIDADRKDIWDTMCSDKNNKRTVIQLKSMVRNGYWEINYYM